jgi:hypothetical protein
MGALKWGKSWGKGRVKGNPERMLNVEHSTLRVKFPSETRVMFNP